MCYTRFRRSRHFWPAAERLTGIGERWGVRWLIYNPLLFTYYHEEAVASAAGVMHTFANVFPQARTYVDVGAGSGAFAARAQKLGRQAVAYEDSALGRLLARRQGVDVRSFDLRKRHVAGSAQRFDLVSCFEIAEHLEPTLGDQLVRFCAAHAPIVVFTAAPPGQGGTGHVNEQPQTYWIDKFQAEGMTCDERLSAQVADGFRREGVPSVWLADNVMVFAPAID